MKTHSSKTRRSGFTLIELLVVITIIAALAALSFTGINAALKKTRKTESEVIANALVTAVEKFETEYNRLPDVGAGGDVVTVNTNTSDGVELLRILLADEGTGGSLQNKRKLVLLDVKEAKAQKGGVDYGTSGNSSAQALYDTFGNPYTVVLNAGYRNALTFTIPEGAEYNLRGESVAVYSAGADRELGTSDDITTFRKR